MVTVKNGFLPLQFTKPTVRSEAESNVAKHSRFKFMSSDSVCFNMIEHHGNIHNLWTMLGMLYLQNWTALAWPHWLNQGPLCRIAFLTCDFWQSIMFINCLNILHIVNYGMTQKNLQFFSMPEFLPQNFSFIMWKRGGSSGFGQTPLNNDKNGHASVKLILNFLMWRMQHVTSFIVVNKCDFWVIWQQPWYPMKVTKKAVL